MKQEPVMDHDEDTLIDDELRTAEEIARRSLVLGALISTVYGVSISDVCSWLKAENLWEELSPDELAYIENPANNRAQINLSWHSEALVVLLWSINKISSLPPLTIEVDTTLIKAVLVSPPHSTKQFISSAYLRDEEEVLREYETVYESHWSVRDSKIHNKPIPNNLNPSVVYERHFGFNYVTGYCSLNWDDITCDT
jgi:Domain of unknown function (DUF4272)